MDVGARQHTQSRRFARSRNELYESGGVPSTDYRGLPESVAIEWSDTIGLRPAVAGESVCLLNHRAATRPSFQVRDRSPFAEMEAKTRTQFHRRGTPPTRVRREIQQCRRR